MIFSDDHLQLQYPVWFWTMLTHSLTAKSNKLYGFLIIASFSAFICCNRVSLQIFADIQCINDSPVQLSLKLLFLCLSYVFDTVLLTSGWQSWNDCFFPPLSLLLTSDRIIIPESSCLVDLMMSSCTQQYTLFYDIVIQCLVRRNIQGVKILFLVYIENACKPLSSSLLEIVSLAPVQCG